MCMWFYGQSELQKYTEYIIQGNLICLNKITDTAFSYN